MPNNTSNNKDGQPVGSEPVVVGGNGGALWTDNTAAQENGSSIEGGEAKPTTGYQRATKNQF